MNQFFKINLNKYGELKKKAEREKTDFVKVLFFFIIVAVVMFGFVFYINMNLDKKIDSRKDLHSKIKDEIKSYQVSGEYLSSKDLNNMTKISTERIFWAKKLVALSEKTNDKIAITNFAFKNDVLSIYGITRLDKGQKEFDLIDEFITNLKNNEQINQDFPDIKFVKSRRDTEKDVEILRFQVDAIQREFEKEGKKK